MSETLDLFDFGINDKGEYVNLKEEERARWHTYTYEEIVGKENRSNDFCVVATIWGNSVNTTDTLEQVQKEIEEIAQSKCYHYGNMEKGIYAYSYCITYDDGEKVYWFIIENPKHIVVVRHINDINKVLRGEEKISYPACCVYMFEIGESDIKLIRGGYGHYKEDIRYKVLCEEFKILEFSTNRIYPNKAPKDFYEAEYKLSDFIKYWGEKNEKNSLFV